MAMMHCNYCNQKRAASFYKCEKCGKVICSHCFSKNGSYKCNDCGGRRKPIK